MKKTFLYSCLLAIAFISCDSSNNDYREEIPWTEIAPPTKPQEPETKPDEPEVPTDVVFNIPEDLQEYYQTINWKNTGEDLKRELASLIEKTHVRKLSYSQVWDASKATDLTPAGNEVYLIYGHKGVNSGTYAYTRGKNTNGGKTGDWNREHVYARSLGIPKLGDTGPGADAHHIRPADVKLNNIRGNDKFAQGDGVSKPVQGGFYPGDEWKGDVARMMMYMYLRYNNQCLPSNVAIGERNTMDRNMVNLLLEWNAQDPVSDIERKRNDYHQNQRNQASQGNRNPFIDNPYLANAIWGIQKDTKLNATNIW